MSIRLPCPYQSSDNSSEDKITIPEYPKIDCPFIRDPESGKLFFDEWRNPEYEYLCNNSWVATEKVDGMNTRVHFQNGEFFYLGQTDKAQIPLNLLQYLVSLFEPLKDKFIENMLCESITLFGEGYGGKIQNGGKYSSEEKFILFDIKIGHWWLKREDLEEISSTYNIPLIPVYSINSFWYMLNAVSKGLKSKFGDFIAEGLVCQPKFPLYTRHGRRIITKIKYCDFQSYRES